MTDGLGLMCLFANITDVPDENLFKRMKKISIWLKLWIYLLLPYNALVIFVRQFFFYPNNPNPMCNGKPLIGIKKSCFSNELSV